MRSSAGEYVPGRCRATNLCDYCARLAAVEYSEMLALDAVAGVAPSVWAVLTTRTSTLDTAAFYRGREKVVRALRRRWPGCEYVCLVEFTTGYADRRGLRRPHWNLLLKGIPLAELAEAESIIKRVWCSHADALPQGQYVGGVSEVGGLMRYLALHFLKESQRPPKGWKGQRVNFSRGYFGRPVWMVRRDAQRSLRLKREMWRAENEGYEGVAVLDVAELAVERAERKRWELVSVTLDEETGELLRARALRGGEPVTARLVRRYPAPDLLGLYRRAVAEGLQSSGR